MNESSERRRRQRRRWLHFGGDTLLHPADVAFLMYGVSEVVNNRLVIFLAFDVDDEEDRIILMAKLRGELKAIAATRLLPHGRPIGARTLYRLLCIKHFRGSVHGNASARIAMWADTFKRNGRTGVEVNRLVTAFHRQASVLMSQGEAPIALLDRLLGLGQEEH